ncbi:hypothetical protein CLV40_11299 [Actinokineospora auranticolor]|uniref:Uncharacterized protein n=1 Tax=Actinokineospora auranticolor TaxID=155976 RepID=A0A2S6GKS8_9PSEU|nr:hypothetical protein CLV40_11299 [Actinokineospora auranticolor]
MTACLLNIRTGGHSAKNARRSGAPNNHEGSGDSMLSTCMASLPRSRRSTTGEYR